MKITTKSGLAVCVIAWLVLAFVQVRGFDCLKFGAECGAKDLYLAMIIGGGMLVPAYILGSLVSAMFGGENES